jgi:putative DNA primase/helicase
MTNESPPPSKITLYNLTDYGNAQRMVAMVDGRARYVDRDGWYLWDKKRWKPDRILGAHRIAKKTVRAIYKAAKQIGDEEPELRKAMVQWAKKCESSARLNALLEVAASEPGIPVTAEEFDKDPWLFNMANGTFNLKTQQLQKHNGADLITKLSPVAYHPDAACPQFDAFMLQIFKGNTDLIFYVLKLLGMCLTGDITEQIFPVFWGGGANGKSTLLEVVAYIMGDYFGVAPETLLMAGKRDEHPTELADLQGRRLVVASETEDGGRLKLQLVKRLTGEPVIKARRMRMDFFEFPRTHKLIMMTNAKPIIRENSEAAWRRVQLTPFEYVVPPELRDKHLPEKLKAEASGIFNRLVAGCVGWQQEGLKPPAAVVEATNIYREESDPLGDFASECCQFGPTFWTSNNDLRGRYTSFCDSQHEKPVGPRAFAKFLEGHGCKSSKSRHMRGWSGVCLVSPAVGYQAETEHQDECVEAMF